MQTPPTSSESDDQDFKPLTREQARLWRQKQPKESPWALVTLQWGLLLSGAVILLTLGGVDSAISFGYGGVAIAVPTLIMVVGLVVRRGSAQAAQPSAGVYLVKLFFWEGVKLLVAVVLMAIAPLLMPDLNWLAMLAGVMLMLKSYWLALLLRRG